MVSSKRPISIAVVSDSVYPFHRGGKETRYHELLTRLDGVAGFTVYTMHWWPERSHTRREEGVEYRAICPLFPLYRAGRRSLVEAIVFSLACLRLVTRRFDVVETDHVPHLQLFTLRLVTKLKRRPLVATWYEVWGREYWVDYLGRLAGAVAWWVERRAMRLPDEILAISEGTADRLRSLLGDRVPIRVIQPAINLGVIADTAPTDPDEAAELLFVGRLLEHKGVHLLIASLARLQGGRPLRLLVVGAGPERDNLERQAQAAGIGALVRFRSDVTDPREIYALMKAAEVFVYPSVREGFGIALLEALACGTAVVTTSHPDNCGRQLVARSDRGYLAEPTVESITAAIRQALSDGSRSRGPAETWLSEFDWATVSEEYFEALEASLSSRPDPPPQTETRGA
ncbi:MAG: glycosyltransferase family 4 protein [Acidimicrobiales bacterium]|jgi:glycosyltransferase involved in cell wall biosynthesis